MSNRTPLTGRLLQQPDPAPLRRFALYDSGQPCLDHHAPYTGSVSCTGVLQCTLCGTRWNPETGKHIGAGQVHDGSREDPEIPRFGAGDPWYDV